VKSLEHLSFLALAAQKDASYHAAKDALQIRMLGQDYFVLHNGVFLHGQKAPESHSRVLIDYLSSSGRTLITIPWRPIGEFAGCSLTELKHTVEMPIASCIDEIIDRAPIILDMIDGEIAPSIINSDMSFTVPALPKVHLHIELAREIAEFPAEAWILFSRNANVFLEPATIQMLCELFKERILSCLRIY